MRGVTERRLFPIAVIVGNRLIQSGIGCWGYVRWWHGNLTRNLDIIHIPPLMTIEHAVHGIEEELDLNNVSIEGGYIQVLLDKGASGGEPGEYIRKGDPSVIADPHKCLVVTRRFFGIQEMAEDRLGVRKACQVYGGRGDRTQVSPTGIVIEDTLDPVIP